MIDILFELSEALIKKQILDKNNPDYGALYCDSCNCLHTRAGEVILSFMVCYQYSQNKKFLEACVRLGNWLTFKQQAKGFWYETPIKWNGTTVFQLMSLAATYPMVRDYLSPEERRNWHNSIEKAAMWICAKMSDRFANINYSAASSAALMLTYQLVTNKNFKDKAKKLAYLVLKRTNKENFICGEDDGYCPVVGRWGVDLGYNLDMSLGALALYYVLSQDIKVKAVVIKALKTHLKFIYPDGSIDNSWGSRSYKWTMYGSKTAHGCQLALELLSDEEPLFKKISQLNMEYLKKMIHNGLVGYGPHSWRNKSFNPCIYPTFNRATAIAFALHYSFPLKKRADSKITLQKDKGVYFFKSINVCLIKTENLEATISGYRPIFVRWNLLVNILCILLKGVISFNHFKKRTHTPTGGSVSYLWEKDFGIVQASSQTKYSQVEPMHMPNVSGLETLTPHIRLEKNGTVFTNLYDLTVSIKPKKIGEAYTVFCKGKLKDERFNESGAKFKYEYEFDSTSITKTVILWGRKKQANIEIIEPIIRTENMDIKELNNEVILRSGKGNECKFTLLTNNVKLAYGQQIEKYWSPFPYLYAYPIKLVVNDIKKNAILIKYRITFKRGSLNGKE